MEAKQSEYPSSENFVVEDLLDFTNDDGTGDDAPFDTPLDDSSSTVVTPLHDSSNSSSFSGATDLGFPSSAGFSGDDLCVPYEDVAELEWLSNFVDESFSSEDLHKLHLISGMSAMKTRPDGVPRHLNHPTQPSSEMAVPNPILSPETCTATVPGKAPRSKRSRAAPGNWASRLLLLSPSHHAVHPEPAPKPSKPTPKKKGGPGLGPGVPEQMAASNGTGGEQVRRCLHCATDKTPQWRTGPMGPKTLCNACGVRYKSGRLVPEYRPAASPTFVLTKHSNSHRKVMELRRQKEQTKHQQQHLHQHQQQQYPFHHHPSSGSDSNNNSMMFDPPNTDDYLIHQHIGPDFRQLI